MGLIKKGSTVASGKTTLTLDEKLELLGLDDAGREKLSATPCVMSRTPNIFESQIQTITQTIDLDKLVGWNTGDGRYKANWLECLDCLKKAENFYQATDKKKFEKFITNIGALKKAEIPLPVVIAFEGNYYIDGDGKHRLTIAKALGIKKVPVTVRTIMRK